MGSSEARSLIEVDVVPTGERTVQKLRDGFVVISREGVDGDGGRGGQATTGFTGAPR